MRYIIDGYNLMFKKLEASEELAKYRTELIEEIERMVAETEMDVTIVFDSYYHPGESTRHHFHSVEIIFTDEKEIADDKILKLIKASANPQHSTVVTSDKKLAWYARRKTAHTLTVDEFLDLLTRRYKNKITEKKKPNISGHKDLPKKEPLIKPHVPTLEEYYLHSFEKRLEKIEEKKPKKKKKQPLETETKAAELKKRETDMERWQRLFDNQDKP